MKKNVAIIGCGNIGSRHLQALVNVNIPLDIHVVEKNEKSIKTALSLLESISLNKETHKIFWYKSLSKFDHNCDLVIVSTRSPCRIDIISQLLKKGHKKFLIEKIVCQSSHEYKILLQQMQKFSAKAWVNTPRRYFHTYRKIKNQIKNSKFLSLLVFCENVGLGTNAIHYLDLFSWFAADTSLKLEGGSLIPKIFPSKRGSKFKEFYGTITGSTKSGKNYLHISSLPSSRENMTVVISTESTQIIIDELNQKMKIITKNVKNSKFLFEFTSSLTTQIVSDILKKDFCYLPSLQDSFLIHDEIFNIFNTHLKKQLKRDIDLCPIT